MDQIKWRPVKNYEGLYEINQYGNVRSLCKRHYHKIMKDRIDRGGYVSVKVSKGDRCSTQYVHRLLAFAFIENPDNKRMVNHIDGNKLNNDLKNLEWCTASENMVHAYKLRLCSPKPRKVIDGCTGEIFNSAKSAAKILCVAYPTMKNYLNGNRHNPTCLKYAS